MDAMTESHPEAWALAFESTPGLGLREQQGALQLCGGVFS
jgi:hypothetical protein